MDGYSGEPWMEFHFIPTLFILSIPLQKLFRQFRISRLFAIWRRVQKSVPRGVVVRWRRSGLAAGGVATMRPRSPAKHPEGWLFRWRWRGLPGTVPVGPGVRPYLCDPTFVTLPLCRHSRRRTSRARKMALPR